MEPIPFIPNESINFILPKPNRKFSATKFCPICSDILGTIGLIRAMPKVCQYCSRTVCKRCANRKITSEKKHICKECFEAGLKNYYISNKLLKITNDIDDYDRIIENKNSIHESLVKELEKLENSMSRTKEDFKAEWDDIKQKIIPIVEKFKKTKAECSEVRNAFMKKEQKITKIDQSIEDLYKQNEKIHIINTQKREKLIELRDELALYQEEDGIISNKLHKKKLDARHPEEQGNYNLIKSVKDLRTLAKIKYKENQEMNMEKDRLECELIEIEKELKSFGGRKSCRFSGNFDVKEIHKTFAKQSDLEIISEVDDSIGEEQIVEDLKKIYEENRKSLNIDEPNDKVECSTF